MKLSIVTTLFNTSDTLDEFLNRCISTAAGSRAESLEIIIIDDGSSYEQFERAKKVCANFHGIKLVVLSRNFGHHHALMEGLSQATGDYIFLIDSDLEENPLDGIKLFNELQERGADLVFGYQTKRRGSLLERVSGGVFYFFMRNLMGVRLPTNLMTSRMMTRRYVDALLRHSENQLNFSGLALITGFEQVSIPLEKIRLRSGSYSISKKFAILIDAVTSFSTRPLKGIFLIGLGICSASSLFIFGLILDWLFQGNQTSGWASLVVSIWFLGGLIMLSLGILGIYLSKIFLETKNRPRTIIREILTF